MNKDKSNTQQINYATLIDSRETPKNYRPLITVAIPAYAHEKYISECISAITKCKNLEAIELIILDDHSPDKTLEIARKRLSSSKANYRLYSNTQNKGLTRGLNFLLSQSNSEFVIFCASDDRIVTDQLDRVIEKYKTGDQPQTFEIFSAVYIGDKTGPVYKKQNMLRSTANTRAFCKKLSTEIPKPLLLQSTIFRTDFIKRLDPWADNLILDDWPTFLRAGLLAEQEKLQIMYNPEITLTEYRAHRGGQHNNIERQKRACIEVVEKVVPVKFKTAARANVISEFGAIDFIRGRYLKAVCEYGKAIATHPSPSTAIHMPSLIAQAFLSKIRRVITHHHPTE